MTDEHLLGRTTHVAIDEAEDGWAALGPVFAGFGRCRFLIGTRPDEGLELAANC